MWSVQAVAVTGEEPVTLSDAKASLKVEHSDDDVQIKGLIAAAREMVEDKTGVLLREQQIEVTFDAFSDPLRLPRWPVSEVEGVAYGEDGLVEGYRLIRRLGAASLAPALCARWPSVSGQVVVTANAGFALEDVPERLKTAIIMLVGDWYERRETPDGMSPGVKALISDFRLSWL